MAAHLTTSSHTPTYPYLAETSRAAEPAARPSSGTGRRG
ncbi:hypothetical protein STRIP9103_03366 [Streptomyces ipomoeae 91-03]|uniref:Uncharacterized protein n=1 Tax=Streptomyces ipomoeae 91-03 TaxID=698759 RepID=L1L664_9ACTN|nr:hypothetical protein STRIP9103_03366 [Streptomyces ipomoeae 91-03]